MAIYIYDLKFCKIYVFNSSNFEISEIENLGSTTFFSIINLPNELEANSISYTYNAACTCFTDWSSSLKSCINSMHSVAFDFLFSNELIWEFKFDDKDDDSTKNTDVSCNYDFIWLS